MNDTESSKHAEGETHPVNKLAKEFHIRPQVVVEITVTDHVNALALVEFSFHVEEVFVHCLSRAQLIHQPNVGLVFAAVE